MRGSGTRTPGPGPRCSGNRSATPCSASPPGGWLLNRHKAADITPYALLVPIFGLGATAIWLHEPLPLWKLAATGLVVAGLVLNTVSSGLAARRAAQAAATG